jgi:hypothetical protein
MRVLIDLVVNHTSNEHPWFQEARRDPKSKYRDWYCVVIDSLRSSLLTSHRRECPLFLLALFPVSSTLNFAKLCLAVLPPGLAQALGSAVSCRPLDWVAAIQCVLRNSIKWHETIRRSPG